MTAFSLTCFGGAASASRIFAGAHVYDSERHRIDLYRNVEKERSKADLKVLMLGRVDNEAKGVFNLPKIARLLRDAPISFTVAGDGPDLEALRTRCALHAEQVSFLGAVGSKSVPDLLASHDVLLLPSRFEGMPLALVEAIAAGCVPIASHIRGVTDFVIADGRADCCSRSVAWQALARRFDCSRRIGSGWLDWHPRHATR